MFKKVKTRDTEGGILDVLEKPDSMESELDPKMGILDKVLFALGGAPTSSLTPEDQRRRAGKRSQASQLAQAGANNPGDSFMGTPNVGGTGAGIGGLLAGVLGALGVRGKSDIDSPQPEAKPMVQPEFKSRPENPAKSVPTGHQPFQIDNSPAVSNGFKQIDPNEILRQVAGGFTK